jgi:predicted Zn-dependent protease
VLAALWTLGAAAGIAACAGARGSTASDDAEQAKPKHRTVLVTESDDRRVGEKEQKAAIADLGLMQDDALQAYVQRIGDRVAAQAPERSFTYRFQVLNPWTPNAFALPGGFIFISRGLLALTNSEDELAGVLGHEIVHAAARHAAAQQVIASATPFAFGWWGAAQLAAYARDQEREADDGGQRLAVAAGYDPLALADLLRGLEQEDRLQLGASRLPGFFAHHPTNTERMATAFARGRELRIARGISGPHDRASYLHRLEGMVVGDDPAEGVFQGSRFLHPELGIAMSFPEGWTLVNTARMVAAFPPTRDARFSLEGAGQGDDPRVAAGAFLAGEARHAHARIVSAQSLEIGGLPAYEIRAYATTPEGFVASQITWIAHGGTIYRLSATAPTSRADRYFGRARAMARSFRSITDDERASIRVERLRLATARDDEDLAALSRRTDNAWDPARTAVMNGMVPDSRLEGGQLVKIAVSEPYVPPPKPDRSETTRAGRPGGEATAGTRPSAPTGN